MNRIFVRETGYIVDPSTGIQLVNLGSTTIESISIGQGKTFYIANMSTGTMYIGPTSNSVYWPVYQEQKEGPYIAPTSNSVIFAKASTNTSTDPEIVIQYVRF